MFYPAMLNLKGRLVSVIGGGEVALRKVNTLLEYKAKVRVISLEFHEGFKELNNKIEIIKESYREELIADSFMVVAATNSSEVNANIASNCRNNKILCNVVDNMELSDFIVPSSIKRGSLIISVSTLGKSPALASKIKNELEEKYPKNYEDYIEVLGEIRTLLQKNCEDIKERKKILNKVLDLSLGELIKWRNEYEDSCRLQRQ